VTQVDRNFIRVAYQPEVTSQPKCVHDFSTDVSFIPHTAQGQYGKLVSSLPSLVGTDFVGVVEAIGSEVQDIKVGYDVVGLCPLDSCGAWAEYVVADAHSIGTRLAKRRRFAVPLLFTMIITNTVIYFSGQAQFGVRRGCGSCIVCGSSSLHCSSLQNEGVRWRLIAYH
jgi:hypothetical protein